MKGFNVVTVAFTFALSVCLVFSVVDLGMSEVRQDAVVAKQKVPNLTDAEACLAV